LGATLFPYGVIYSIEQDEILILAAMHLRRHPDYWKKILKWQKKSVHVDGLGSLMLFLLGKN